MSISVVEGKKLRMVMNGAPLNFYIPDMKFKMHTMADFAAFVQPNTRSLTWDLKHAFYQVACDPASMPYHCFDWRLPGSKQPCYFSFVSNPFGLKLSPIRYHKQRTFPLTDFFSRVGLDIMGYLDDANISVPDHPALFDRDTFILRFSR